MVALLHNNRIAICSTLLGLLAAACGKQDNADSLKRFQHAAWLGDTAAVAEAIRNGIAAETPNDSGVTALMLAARQGHAVVVRQILAKTSQVDASDNKGRTALQWALSPEILPGRTDASQAVHIARLLLDRGASPNIETGLVPPLVSVAYLPTHYLELATLLVDRGARLEQRNAEGQTALIVAARNGRVDLVELLVRMGADVNARDNRGKSAVAHAMGNTDLMRILFGSGARPR